MKPCLSEALTMPQTFAVDVATFAGAGCDAMEVWLTKLEEHLKTASLDDTRKLLDERGMRLVAAAYQGGLLLSQGEQRKAHYDHFRSRLDLCQQLGIPTMIVVADFVEKVDATALQRAAVSLVQAAQWAAAFGVKLALEFRGHSMFCASLDTALDLIRECREPNVGVCLDVFHYYTGPSKFEDLEQLTPENLTHVQLSDLAGVFREIAADGNRVLPGDGDFRLGPILEQIRKIGYEGYVSVEVFDKTLWQLKPAQVAEVAMTALRKVLGPASA
jgi:4-hydroxyphenylpyruvate dioxygenase